MWMAGKKLETNVFELIQGFNGDAGIYVRHLFNNIVVGVNENKIFHFRQHDQSTHPCKYLIKLRLKRLKWTAWYISTRQKSIIPGRAMTPYLGSKMAKILPSASC